METREIKFRAWARVGKWDEDGEKQQFEMIYPDSLCWDGKHSLIADSLKDVEDDCYFMQYTGMKDKNGVEIYEGDIIVSESYRYFDLVKITEEVTFSDGEFYPVCESPSHLFEIIGNIYQNPELLQQ